MKKDMPLLTISEPNMTYLPVDKVVTWDIGNELPVRASGEFEMRAFYLDSFYDWVVGYDSFGSKILVALKPQEDTNPVGTSQEPE
ncbi:hypothetical protein KAR91_65535 [Candidatus Pacearchaeota archaeon]|nr:hypothetical protein [Candidatus Pacearchaeota archaeon]